MCENFCIVKRPCLFLTQLICVYLLLIFSSFSSSLKACSTYICSVASWIHCMLVSSYCLVPKSCRFLEFQTLFIISHGAFLKNVLPYLLCMSTCTLHWLSDFELWVHMSALSIVSPSKMENGDLLLSASRGGHLENLGMLFSVFIILFFAAWHIWQLHCSAFLCQFASVFCWWETHFMLSFCTTVREICLWILCWSQEGTIIG